MKIVLRTNRRPYKKPFSNPPTDEPLGPSLLLGGNIPSAGVAAIAAGDQLKVINRADFPFSGMIAPVVGELADSGRGTFGASAARRILCVTATGTLSLKDRQILADAQRTRQGKHHCKNCLVRFRRLQYMRFALQGNFVGEGAEFPLGRFASAAGPGCTPRARVNG